MSANTIPDDVMRAAVDLVMRCPVTMSLTEIYEFRDAIAHAILAEREAQKERDAKTALSYAPLTGFTLLGLRKAIALAILNPPSAASSRAEQTGEAQSSSASPVANSDWITWCGGECPVAGRAWVDTKLRGGDVTYGMRASFWDRDPSWWEHKSWNHDNDIIAYRVISVCNHLTHEEAQ